MVGTPYKTNNAENFKILTFPHQMPKDVIKDKKTRIGLILKF